MGPLSKSLLFLASLGIACVALAEPRLACHGCSAAAMVELAGDTGPGSKYVFDFPGDAIRRFAVSCPASPDDPNTCFGAPQVQPIELPPGVSDEFTLARRVWSDTFGTFTKRYDVDYANTGFFWHGTGDNGPSAYTVIADYNFRTMFSDHIGRNGDSFASGLEYLRGHLHYLNQVLQAYAGQLDGLTINFVVRFPDGTSATFQWKYGEAAATYVETSGRTPGGQGIPEDLGPGGSGSWHSVHEPAEDLERMVRFLQLRGVQVTRGDATRIRSLSCSWDGRTLSCSTT